jgi:probable phosphomutase (TIGR03848 family)
VRVLLVRHGAGAHVGRRLAGRAPGTTLNDEGRAQAERLAEVLAPLAPAAVYASPLERAHETAAPLARRLGADVRTVEGLTELDFGEWTGADFHAMADDPAWRHFNSYRSGTRIPGGELMLEVQARAVAELLRLRDRHEDETIVAVSHGDTIRAILGHFAGIPIDLLHRVEISPASITELELAEWGCRVLCVNSERPSTRA